MQLHMIEKLKWEIFHTHVGQVFQSSVSCELLWDKLLKSNGGDESVKPSEKATLTIRLIRSFPHKNWKPFVIHGVNLSTSTEELISHIYASLPESKVSVPFKTFKGYDCLKIETHRFGYKTNDPLINTEDDDKLILKDSLSLLEQGVEHETEISFFDRKEYEKYKEVIKTGPPS